MLILAPQNAGVRGWGHCIDLGFDIASIEATPKLIHGTLVDTSDDPLLDGIKVVFPDCKNAFFMFERVILACRLTMFYFFPLFRTSTMFHRPDTTSYSSSLSGSCLDLRN